MTEKAINYKKYDIGWDEFIKICKEINYAPGTSKKGRMEIQKQLQVYKEPQTQFLVLSVSFFSSL